MPAMAGAAYSAHEATIEKQIRCCLMRISFTQQINAFRIICRSEAIHPFHSPSFHSLDDMFYTQVDRDEMTCCTSAAAEFTIARDCVCTASRLFSMLNRLPFIYIHTRNALTVACFSQL